MQKGVCEIQDAYVRFSEIFESYLHEDSQMVCEEKGSAELKLLKRIVVTVVNHFHLNEELNQLRK